MLRDAFDCYTLFEKHIDVFNASKDFTEFIKLAKLNYLDNYIGGWIESAFNTLKAGKKTYKSLYFPQVNKFSELFESVVFIPTDTKNKPAGHVFLSGNAGFCMNCGGKRGWSTRNTGTRCHYGAKFYGTYVKPTNNVVNFLSRYFGDREQYTFEAIRREDGILIVVNHISHIGSAWVALLDLSENIESLFDDDTRLFISNERDDIKKSWGEK